jgi:DNA-nicking Smr family endonuclease
MPIEARLDLHGMTQSEAHEALARFLTRAQKHGVRAALVITGKSGVLHGAVPRWLDDETHRGRIIAASRAHAQHGGAGALYLLLRRAK